MSSINEKALEDHMKADHDFQEKQTDFNEKVSRVLFGNGLSGSEKEMGMKEKVDAMYTMLVQSEGLIRLFGGLKGLLGFLIVLAAAIAVIKGWFIPK